MKFIMRCGDLWRTKGAWGGKKGGERRAVGHGPGPSGCGGAGPNSNMSQGPQHPARAWGGQESPCEVFV